MELCSIASGSSGNCIYAGTESSHLMIDAGISGKRIEAGLNSIGLKTAEMQALLVTHEHSDHISGLGVVARKYGIPIYATAETIEAVKGISSVGKVDETLFHPIEAGVEFQIGDITVEEGIKGIIPYLIAEIAALLLITYIPSLVTYVPVMLGYSVV